MPLGRFFFVEEFTYLLLFVNSCGIMNRSKTVHVGHCFSSHTFEFFCLFSDFVDLFEDCELEKNFCLFAEMFFGNGIEIPPIAS